jgi:hypothetical protein
MRETLLCLFSALFLFISGNVSAVILAGTIENNSYPVVGATVKILDVQQQVMGTVKTDQNGNFKLKNLVNENFLLSVMAEDGALIGPANLKISGTITDASETPVEARKIVLMSNSVKLESRLTDKSGKFIFEILSSKYLLARKKENAFARIHEDENASVILSPLQFTNDGELSLDAENELDPAVAFMKKYTKSIIVLFPSPDSVSGTISGEKKLEIIANYFKTQGIPSERIKKSEISSDASISGMRMDLEWIRYEPLAQKKTEPEIQNTIEPDKKNTTTSPEKKLVPTSPASSGIVYKVQITTSGKQLASSDKTFKGVEGVEFYVDGGTYKYTVGTFSNINDAIALQNEMRSKGFNGAFVVKFIDGVRMK